MALHMHSFGRFANQRLICVACYVGADRQDAHCEKSAPLMSDVCLGCVARICFLAREPTQFLVMRFSSADVANESLAGVKHDENVGSERESSGYEK